jgi:hypothetical protein
LRKSVRFVRDRNDDRNFGLALHWSWSGGGNCSRDR